MEEGAARRPRMCSESGKIARNRPLPLAPGGPPFPVKATRARVRATIQCHVRLPGGAPESHSGSESEGQSRLIRDSQGTAEQTLVRRSPPSTCVEMAHCPLVHRRALIVESETFTTASGRQAVSTHSDCVGRSAQAGPTTAPRRGRLAGGGGGLCKGPISGNCAANRTQTRACAAAQTRRSSAAAQREAPRVSRHGVALRARPHSQSGQWLARVPARGGAFTPSPAS